MAHSRVIVAEEDPALQEGLSSALKKSGFEVRVFDSGYPVVEMMDNWPDVFLIDIALAGINGMEVCKWLKSHDSSRDIPVILISGEPYLKVLAASAHPDDYIEKPVSFTQVVQKVRECLPSAKTAPRKTTV